MQLVKASFHVLCVCVCCGVGVAVGLLKSFMSVSGLWYSLGQLQIMNIFPYHSGDICEGS